MSLLKKKKKKKRPEVSETKFDRHERAATATADGAD